MSLCVRACVHVRVRVHVRVTIRHGRLCDDAPGRSCNIAGPMQLGACAPARTHGSPPRMRAGSDARPLAAGGRDAATNLPVYLNLRVLQGRGC